MQTAQGRLLELFFKALLELSSALAHFLALSVHGEGI